jgi:hypothetical protein
MQVRAVQWMLWEILNWTVGFSGIDGLLVGPGEILVLSSRGFKAHGRRSDELVPSPLALPFHYCCAPASDRQDFLDGARVGTKTAGPEDAPVSMTTVPLSNFPTRRLRWNRRKHRTNIQQRLFGWRNGTDGSGVGMNGDWVWVEIGAAYQESAPYCMARPVD